MAKFRSAYLLFAFAAIVAWLPAEAQLQRGARTVVHGGQLTKSDGKQKQRDSIAHAELVRQIEHDMDEGFKADSAAVTALRTDDIARTDSLLAVRLAGGEPTQVDTAFLQKHKKGGFMPDSMGLSKVCWLSAIMPGYGQIYNKQYWKLPILYGALGAGIGLFISENKTYKPLKKQYEAMIAESRVRTPAMDDVQSRMIRSNTKRQLYMGLTIGSYIYFMGDVALNYKTNDVSDVKKATTLACIFPGAGQIYNKSYWKVPFVIGGFAGMIYCIDWNNRGYQRYKNVYSLMVDYKNNPDKYPDGPPEDVALFSGYSAEYMKNLRNNFRRNRDLCIIITAGLYILQIIDAHVDAHLKDYDISDDLSMNIEPMVDYTYVPTQGGNRPVFGFNLNLKF